MIVGLVAELTVKVPGKLADFLSTVVPDVKKLIVLLVPSPYNSKVAFPTDPIPSKLTAVVGKSIKDRLQLFPNAII